jgi:hypothetical protein
MVMEIGFPDRRVDAERQEFPDLAFAPDRAFWCGTSVQL